VVAKIEKNVLLLDLIFNFLLQFVCFTISLNKSA